MTNFSANTFQKGLGIPWPGCVPVCAGSRQAPLWAAAGAGIEQKQMCARCCGWEALAEAQNAVLGTESWKSVSLDRLLLVSRSNPVYFEVLGVQPQALSLSQLGGGHTAGVVPVQDGWWHRGGCASSRAHCVCSGTGSSQSSLTCMAGFWGLEAGYG